MKILRDLRTKDGNFELLLEIDKETLERYQADTGDYSDSPELFSEWLNRIINDSIDD